MGSTPFHGRSADIKLRTKVSSFVFVRQRDKRYIKPPSLVSRPAAAASLVPRATLLRVVLILAALTAKERVGPAGNEDLLAVFA